MLSDTTKRPGGGVAPGPGVISARSALRRRSSTAPFVDQSTAPPTIALANKVLD